MRSGIQWNRTKSPIFVLGHVGKKEAGRDLTKLKKGIFRRQKEENRQDGVSPQPGGG